MASATVSHSEQEYAEIKSRIGKEKSTATTTDLEPTTLKT